MDWGDNTNLVEESDPIQGREHIKLMVVIVGYNIDLECQVAFTSKPVSKIMWKIDGKLKTKVSTPNVENKNGEVMVEDHLIIDNITEEMDGSTVSCEYSKGQYGGSVEAILRVFKLEIELSEKDCNTLVGDIKLVFKESKRSSPAEDTVNNKIKSMIAELTNLSPGEITVDKSGYFVILPIQTVQGNQKIMDMKQKLIKDGVPVMDELGQCTTSTTTSTTSTTTSTTSAKSDEMDWSKNGPFIVTPVVLIVITVVLILATWGKKMIENISNLAGIKKMRLVRDEEAYAQMLEYCKYCNFKTDTKNEMEKHIAQFKITHSTLNYNDHHQDVMIETSKMKKCGFKLNMVQLTVKQKEYLNNNIYISEALIA